ncbi:MAG TPA: HEAT repeat domain-containing protein [Tepidisphaeraceae bacterium]|nr:HEAT repeat domain-containing protein [Tepidisphaeraceae bacterium]
MPKRLNARRPAPALLAMLLLGCSGLPVETVPNPRSIEHPSEATVAAVDAVLQAIDDQYPRSRPLSEETRRRIREIADDHPKLVRQILDTLDVAAPADGARLVRAVGALGADAAEAVPKLMELRFGGGELAAVAAAALADMGPPAVRAYSEKVRHGGPREAAASAAALASPQLLPYSGEAGPVLRERMTQQEDVDDLLEWARYAAAVSSSPERFRGEYRDISPMSDKAPAAVNEIYAEFRQSREAQAVLSSIRTAADSEDINIAFKAVQLLPLFGVPAEQAVPSAVQLYARAAREDELGLGAVGFFQFFAAYGRAAVPPLITLATSGDDALVRKVAVGFLALRDPMGENRSALSPEVVPTLIKVLMNDRNADVRGAAISALSAIWPSTDLTIDALQQASVNDDSVEVRAKAKAALKRIADAAQE